MKCKIVLICTFVILSSSISYGQGFEKEIFKALCDEVINLNTNIQLIKDLKDAVVLAYEPIADKYSLFYKDTSDIKVKNILRKYSNEQLMVRMKDNGILPIQPIGDKYVILDSTALFSDSIVHKSHDNIFKLITNTTDEYSACIYKTGIEKEGFYVSISMPNTSNCIVLLYEYKNNNLSFIKRTVYKRLQGE